MFWLGLIVGATLIGSPVGFIVAAFCAAAKRGDEYSDIVYQNQKNK